MADGRDRPGRQPLNASSRLFWAPISEAGRTFLASRLLLLRDPQIRDLFTAAMAERRGGTVDEWVRVFKRKRDEIVNARCAA